MASDTSPNNDKPDDPSLHPKHHDAGPQLSAAQRAEQTPTREQQAGPVHHVREWAKDHGRPVLRGVAAFALTVHGVGAGQLVTSHAERQQGTSDPVELASKAPEKAVARAAPSTESPARPDSGPSGKPDSERPKNIREAIVVGLDDSGGALSDPDFLKDLQHRNESKIPIEPKGATEEPVRQRKDSGD